jgi:hypothetical protein
MEAEATLAKLQQDHSQFDKNYALDVEKTKAAIAQGNVVSVQGGLYDLSTGKYIVSPKPDSGGSGSSADSGVIDYYAKQVSDDPSTLSSVPSGIRNKVVARVNEIQAGGDSTSSGGVNDQAVTPSTGFFTPTPDVRIRDVLRELPAAAIGKGWLW